MGLGYELHDRALVISRVSRVGIPAIKSFEATRLSIACSSTCYPNYAELRVAQKIFDSTVSIIREAAKLGEPVASSACRAGQRRESHYAVSDIEEIQTLTICHTL